ncbi:signal peptide peptidase SppA, partial [Planctomycetota bacterium]
GMNIFVYALLCTSDHLSVAPESALWLVGLHGESLYLKGLLDKIGVQADFMHMGDYKSAAESLTRTGPSKPAAENTEWLFDGLYDSLVTMIAKSRGKTPDAVKALVDKGPYLANAALEQGLIDAVETRVEFLARIEKDMEREVRFNNRYGGKAKKAVNMANPMAMFTIFAEMFQPPKPSSQKDMVAIVYVEGAIMSGHSQPSPWGETQGAYSGDIRKALETAANDKNIKAVVMRVNSPGGSAEASEVILNAARYVQSKKPLIVSMGNVAGSGGYYIACGADAIFANAATITASIGVVGGKLITTHMWDKLGVSWVSYQRGANADIFSSAKPFSDDQRDKLEAYMQEVYDVFKGHVEKGRGYRLRKPLDELAGGRVFTGKQAQELGLVDFIGGLKEALDCAAEKAGLEDYDTRIIPRPKDFITMMMEQHSGQDNRPTDIGVGDVSHLLSGIPNVQGLLQMLQKTEPRRAQALIEALQRIELIRREGVIMMMPDTLVIH